MSTLLHVLIVEDSQDDAFQLLRELHRAAYEVISERVETAEAMNAALDRAEWDIVLSDYTMPHFSALDALAVLKNRRIDIPFIIISGTIGEETAVKAMKAGAQDFLIKAKLARLIPAMERELGEAQMRRERRRTEESLRKSEERFREIAETIDEVFWVADPHITRMLYISPAYERIWGRSCASLYENPRSFLDSIHSDDRQRVIADLEFQKMGHPFDHEYRVVCPERPVRWVWDRGFPVRDAAGHVIRHVGVAVDITERKLAEAENTRLALIVNSSDDAIFSATVEGLIATWNAGAERMYGYAAEEIRGKHFSILIPEDHRGEISANQEKLFRGEALVHYDFEHMRKAGSKLQVSLTLSPIKDTTGVVTGVSVISRDVTERQRAEKALKEERHLLHTLMDNLPDLIYFKDRQSRFTRINKAHSNLFGLSNSAQAIGKTDFDFFTPEYAQKAHNDEQEIIKTGQPIVNHEEMETWPDGNVTWASTTKMALRDANGNILGTFGVSRDITGRKRLEEQFRQAQKMEAVGRLAGGVAHDFNNLLTIINGYSELVLDRLNSDDPARGQIQEVKKAGDRAASLTRQLLAFSRQQVLAPRVLDLNALVADMEKMLRRLIGEDIDLSVVRDSALGPVKADPGQLEQILMNLAVNARDAMPEGGKLVIETANVEFDDAYVYKHVAVPTGRYVLLIINDTGIGMDAETQAHIFEPFFTTKEKSRGTGLGLAMVYGIVKQSGGFIWVYSELGRGTTFKIYLPRVAEAAEVVQISEVGERFVACSETILLVEDEAAVRALAATVLQACGYQVLESTSPEDALRIGEQHQEPIHMLLTDVVLPRMSGRKIAEMLTLLRPTMKVLYMSGYTDDTVVRSGVLETGTAFLQKPFTPSTLTRKVREVIDTSNEEVS